MSGLIDTGATKLYYELRGSGPALLLITGGAGDAGEWAAVAPALADGAHGHHLRPARHVPQPAPG